MLHPIIIMFKSTARVIWRINKNALNLPRELLLQRFQRKEVISEDQPIIENVMVAYAVLRMIRLLRLFEQNARLQPRPVLLPNPCQFKLLFILNHNSYAG
jgi:hypothetical protein